MANKVTPGAWERFWKIIFKELDRIWAEEEKAQNA